MRELDARANQLAHHLRGLGVGPEAVVGLCVERSPAMLVGLLGILKAGGAYLPLDPGYPPERLAFMLAGCRRAGAGHPIGAASTGCPRMAPASCGSMPMRRRSRAQPSSAPVLTLDPHNTAYVIYTSGSTGEPKGVAVTHGGIANLAAAQIDRFAHHVRSPRPAVRLAELRCGGLGDLRRCWHRVRPSCCRQRNAAAIALARADPRAARHRTRPCRRCCSPICPRTCRSQTLVVGAATSARRMQVAQLRRAGRRMINAYGPTETTVCAHHE